MRIVSLLPSTTEILFAIGAGDDVVVGHDVALPVDHEAGPERLHLLGARRREEGRRDLLGRTVGIDEPRKPRLDRLQALAQLVVLGVGDLRRVLLVIEPVVMADLLGETLVLGARLALGEIVDLQRAPQPLSISPPVVIAARH